MSSRQGNDVAQGLNFLSVNKSPEAARDVGALLAEFPKAAGAVIAAASGVGAKLAPGKWQRIQTMFRLRLVGTGSLTLDSRDALGNVTSGVFTASAVGATNQIEFPYPGDGAVEICATTTGNLIVEVL